MTPKILIKSSSFTKNVKNFALFCDKNFKISDLRKLELSKYSKELIQFTKNTKSSVLIKEKFLIFNVNSAQKVLLIKTSDNDINFDNEKLGADFFDFLKRNYIDSLLFNTENVQNIKKKSSLFFNEFIHGIELKSYFFDKYKKNKDNSKLELTIVDKKNLFSNKKNKRYKALIDGINFTKELVSEPGNILHPDEYAKRLKYLSKLGLKVSIFDKHKLKKLKMNALLGVGQGSIRGSYLVTIEWKGLNSKQRPLAFVGKGVCFDTGGISLKPAKFMEDMTYDMAGSAVVVGLMKTLALRKAKINAVGVVGLVENMPGGNAQRPGDIVKSYSGKTIEILNTDAEGRLVLADALSYTEKKYKPKFIVDLATLTGAIIVSLGSEYAGLFSNDDKLSSELIKAGEKVGEKLWRMPLHKNYDKLINSKNADMQNINYIGGAGSTTAAQFLQRFILNKTPWAHLDIAGMAFSKYGGALNSWGATGFGVRLLNKLIEDKYE